MFTKTGLRVRDTTGNRTFSTGTATSGTTRRPPFLESSPNPYLRTLRVPSRRATRSAVDSKGRGVGGRTGSGSSRATHPKRPGTGAASATSTAQARKAGADATRKVPRKRPEWDDSIRDRSEYRLTPEEAVLRKKSLISKHNTLVFMARGAPSTSPDKERSPAAAAAAAAAAARVAERKRAGGDCEHPGNTGTRGRIANSSTQDSSSLRRRSNSRSRGCVPGKETETKPLPKGHDEADQTVAEVPSAGLHGGIHDATVNSGLVGDPHGDFRSPVVAKPSRRGREDLLDLSGIEDGIRDFSQRVSRLEADQDGGFGLNLDLGGAGTKPGRNIATDEKGSQEVPGVPQARRVVDDNGLSFGWSTPVPSDRGAPSPKLEREGAGGANQSDHEPVLLSETTVQTPQAGAPGKSAPKDAGLLDRVQILEQQVRRLQLTPEAHPGGGSTDADAGRLEGTTTEKDPVDGEGETGARPMSQERVSEDVRAVLEGLLSLNARLLDRATAAEERLRVHRLDADGGGGGGSEDSPPSDDDEELARSLSSQARAILAANDGGVNVPGGAAGISILPPRPHPPEAHHEVGAPPPRPVLPTVSPSPHPQEAPNWRSPVAPLLRTEEPLELHPDVAAGRRTPLSGDRRRPSRSSLPEALPDRDREATGVRGSAKESDGPASEAWPMDHWGQALDAVDRLVSKAPSAAALAQGFQSRKVVTPSPSPTPRPLPPWSALPFEPATADEPPLPEDRSKLAVTAVTPSNHVPIPEGATRSPRRAFVPVLPMPSSRESPALIHSVGSVHHAGSGVGMGKSGSDSGEAGGAAEPLDEVDGVRPAGSLPAPTPTKKPTHPFEARSGGRSTCWARRQPVMSAGGEGVLRYPQPLLDGKVGGHREARRRPEGWGWSSVVDADRARASRGPKPEVWGWAEGHDYGSSGGARSRGSLDPSEPELGEWYTPSVPRASVEG